MSLDLDQSPETLKCSTAVLQDLSSLLSGAISMCDASLNPLQTPPSPSKITTSSRSPIQIRSTRRPRFSNASSMSSPISVPFSTNKSSLTPTQPFVIEIPEHSRRRVSSPIVSTQEKVRKIRPQQRHSIGTVSGPVTTTRSKSGRVVCPPLPFWNLVNPIRDKNGSFLGVTNGSPFAETKKAESRVVASPKKSTSVQRKPSRTSSVRSSPTPDTSPMKSNPVATAEIENLPRTRSGRVVCQPLPYWALVNPVRDKSGKFVGVTKGSLTSPMQSIESPVKSPIFTETQRKSQRLTKRRTHTDSFTTPPPARVSRELRSLVATTSPVRTIVTRSKRKAPSAKNARGRVKRGRVECSSERASNGDESDEEEVESETLQKSVTTQSQKRMSSQSDIVVEVEEVGSPISPALSKDKTKQKPKPVTRNRRHKKRRF